MGSSIAGGASVVFVRSSVESGRVGSARSVSQSVRGVLNRTSDTDNTVGADPSASVIATSSRSSVWIAMSSPRNSVRTTSATYRRSAS